jgi:hypothetical protein
MKITDLEEKLLEAQLQIERLTDERSFHMLSVQKSSTDKTRLGYVASTSDIPSTSKTAFIKPTVPEKIWLLQNSFRSLLSKKALPYATTVA